MIKAEQFGTTPDGKAVMRYTLTGKDITVRIMNFGATILGIDVPDISGTVRDVVLGYDRFEDYLDNPANFGSTVGPVANRTAGGSMVIGGTEYHMPQNENGNNLHSDFQYGLQKRVWDVAVDEEANALHMSVDLAHEELGLPGNRHFTADFSIAHAGTLRIEYGCESDRRTYVAMTNHTYLNLAGHDAGMDCEHFIRAHAEHFLPTDDGNIPTGQVAPVAGTVFDFRELKPIALDIDGDDPQIVKCHGYDHCLCIDDYRYGTNVRQAMHVEEMWTGRELDYYTSAPGVQLYTGNWLDEQHAKDDATYSWTSGLALEAEMYPDTPHHANFPQGFVGPGHPYSNVIEYHFFHR